MAKIRFRAKRVHKIKFADGKIFTILNVDPDPQTGDVTLYLRQSVGIEVFIIPLLMLVGVVMGYMAYSYTGAFAGALIAGLGGIIMMSQMDVTMRPTKRTVPTSSIIGFDSYFQLKERSFCFCCHDFDSNGNPVVGGTDPISIMSNRLHEKDIFIKNLKGQISTLNYRIGETQMGHKELVDTVSAELKKIISSTVTPVKARYPQYPPAGMPSGDFMTASAEEPEEEG